MPKTDHKRKGIVHAQDPTPEQIHERCRTIRQEWTDAIRRQRMSNIKHAWSPPETGSAIRMELADHGYPTAWESETALR